MTAPVEAFMRAFALDGLEMLALTIYAVVALWAVVLVHFRRGRR